MKKFSLFFLLFLTFGSCLLSVHHAVSAEDAAQEGGEENLDVYEDEEEEQEEQAAGEDEEYEDEDEDEYEDEFDSEWSLGPSEDLITTIMFPEHEDGKFAVGEEVTMLISLSNVGDDTYNISHVGAHLHSPFDYSYYIQNFSAQFIGGSVEPDSQRTVEYTFTADKALEPLEFWFSAWVFYNNSLQQPYLNTVYNGTMELVDGPAEFDFRIALTYLVLLGLVGFGVFSFMGSSSKKSSKKTQSTSSKVVDSGFSAPAYKGGSKSVKVSRRNKSKSKKN